MNTDLILAERPKPKEWRGQPVRWIEEKLDGWRVMILRHHNLIEAFGRKPIDLWPKLRRNEEFRRLIEDLPHETAVEGEVICYGNATEVPTAINDGTFQFVAFATARWGGKRVDSFVFHHGFRIPEAFLYTEFPWNGAESVSERKQRLNDLARKRGIEGWVLKSREWMTNGWFKQKPIRTADLVVLDWKEGTSKYEGMMGALIGAVHDGSDFVPIAQVGGGWSDEQRRTIGREAIGRVMEVAYDKRDGRGGLRFPRFVRWRDDREPSSCDLRQFDC